ncbi:DeoR family glycerol-3-phosphate regulon repressor [Thalassospira sp. MBR-102]|jgi:DeoR family glycerol-3-phosphate regulon repressor|uniref:DeoR family transcriptional regulator n=2 Tax=Thalassospira TaxID=168934 RepID=A0AB72UFP9_9PROT|nr:MULTISPECIES: DeoR family transcriptional regulator [Thalassospira]AJD53019.1 DeoR family transcriptional regulator [Thalassospira xiamenensis M-5 = DSM 17429]KEO56743.1 DeoR faimly transcriptional regulator [Thalassospira permensis NBRC 106175]RCK32240.1 DeoR family transcriptional regulator [Thalassospira xiamenensis]SIT29180.1 transcriptional regulator, DeoR family [Thalassospira xiamenensis M-5 = DSM 17429]
MQKRPTERQASIVELVRADGFKTIEQLAERFQVTPQTIRRDVNALCDEGLLRRRHGGVEPALEHENIAYRARKVLHVNEKRKIAALVARAIPDGASLFFSIGTTPELVASALLQHRGLRIFTNNLNVAYVAATNDSFDVTLIGGRLRNRDRDVLGPEVEAFFNSYKVDYGIFGVGGIDADGSLLDFDEQEVRARSAILTNSRQTYLVADHTKFGRNAVVRGGSVTQVTAFFTDCAPPAAIAQMIEKNGVALHIPEPNAEFPTFYVPEED